MNSIDRCTGIKQIDSVLAGETEVKKSANQSQSSIERGSMRKEEARIASALGTDEVPEVDEDTRLKPTAVNSAAVA